MNANQVNNSGTIAYYTFENHYMDSGPNGYHGVIVGSGTPQYYQNYNNQYSIGNLGVTGVQGVSYMNYARCPDNVGAALSGLTNYTIECKFMTDGTEASYYSPIFWIENQAQIPKLYVRISNAIGLPAPFTLYYVYYNELGDLLFNTAAPVLVTANQWHHLAYVHNESGTTVYYDGNYSFGNSHYSIFASGTSGPWNLAFGARGRFAAYYQGYGVYIKDARVSSYAKSASEILQGQPGIV